VVEFYLKLKPTLRIITYLTYICWEIDNFVIKSDIFRRFVRIFFKNFRVTMTTALDTSYSKIQWFCQQGEGFCMHVFSSSFHKLCICKIRKLMWSCLILINICAFCAFLFSYIGTTHILSKRASVPLHLGFGRQYLVSFCKVVCSFLCKTYRKNN
jgi:hypothetical protein